MNKNLQTVYKYHDDTKHRPLRYAKSLGYMDWDTQPNPFRSYENSEQIQMPLALSHDTPEYSEIFTSLAPQSFSLKTISQFFQFSLGLASIKVQGSSSWALRCNASSGNLHPSEAYLIANDIEDIQCGVYHYAPRKHNLELLAKGNLALSLPKESFLIAISSIVWREAWKYGERSWRYTQLDCGHAQRALEISAFMLGWDIKKLDICDDDISSLVGLNQKERYIEQESENPDMLLLVSAKSNNDIIDIAKIRQSFAKNYEGVANQLSPSWHKWEVLEEIENATNSKITPIEKITTTNIKRDKTNESKKVVLTRRSAQMMNKEKSNFSYEQFDIIISSVSASLDSKPCAVHLVLFIHNVEKLESGLYILIRNKEHKQELKRLMKDSFLWEKEELDTENKKDLYLLEKGNFQNISKKISCSQDIASDSAFSIGMLTQFTEQFEKYGSHRYKELYWECGAIGQQLYLEANSLNLSATGIGCFLDDIFHQLLELKTNQYQSLYHFTIGRGILDTRLSDIEPYRGR